VREAGSLDCEHVSIPLRDGEPGGARESTK
jgi:hypothetical protein